MKYKLALCFAVLLGVSFSYTCASRAGVKSQLASHKLVIMTFNVENLFDTEHDSGKDDHTFLPKAQKASAEHQRKCEKIEVKKWKKQCQEFDWSRQALDQKMQNLTDVIKGVNAGKGPDILILQEIENEAVLRQWNETYLKGMHYQSPILIEGSDARGIDVAILSRFPKVGTSVLHPVPFKNMPDHRKKDARGILDAVLEIAKGQTLRVLAVHFPAPYHAPEFRKQSLIYLNELLNRAPEDFTVAAGDFNIPSDENDREQFIEALVEPSWIPVHKLCRECLGTTYYEPKKNWSFLDMILVSKSIAKTPWSIDDVQVVSGQPIQKNKKGHPKSFGWPDKAGVSDHFPLLLKLKRSF